jgi:asparagine synthase (glutamine-hydrolysing)
MPAALLLAFRPNGLEERHAAAFERVLAALPDGVRSLRADELVEPGVRVRAFSHDAGVGDGVERAGDGWAVVLGNPTRADLASVPAAAIPARILEGGRDGLDTLSPPYAIVLRERAGGPVHVAVDRCGLQHLYLREEADGTVWLSSSLLALAEGLGGTLDADAAAEWLGAGHFVSERTMIREVRKVGAGERLALDEAGCRSVSRWVPGPPERAADDEELRGAFLAAVRAGHGDPATAAELTGGLDSRLVLAARLTLGLPALSWTIGDPESPELRTVRRLQRAAGFEHVDAPVPLEPGRDPVELVRRMHALADGEVNALEYAPLLQAWPRAEGRWRVSMSGAGGETARGYYYAAIKDGRVSTEALAHKLAGHTGPAVAAISRERFPDPHAPLRGAIECFLAGARVRTPENVLEDVYLRTRMQRFAGRNTSTTGYFYRQSLPFFDNDVVGALLGLPPSRKNDGQVVRDAVAAWAPALARIPLDSGIGVAPRSWRHPATQLRWGAAMGRKAFVRYGGAAGRRVAPVPSVPWGDWRARTELAEFVRDTLPPDGSRVHELLEPAATAAIVDSALAGGDLYSLGLVLTLELTLERLSRASAPAPAPVRVDAR